MFHLLAVPATVLGFLAAWDYHQVLASLSSSLTVSSQERTDGEGKPAPIPHFYSIHSWLGLVTMAVYALQVTLVLSLSLLLSPPQYHTLLLSSWSECSVS